MRQTTLSNATFMSTIFLKFLYNETTNRPVLHTTQPAYELIFHLQRKTSAHLAVFERVLTFGTYNVKCNKFN